jgi:hypothetical protein
MQGIGLLADQSTWVDTAIVAKWALHEAWLYCVEVLEKRLKDGQISAEEKMKLDEMYTAFFHQAFYAAVKTKADFDKLVRNCRKMLSMLKNLDQDTWARFILCS